MDHRARKSLIPVGVHQTFVEITSPLYFAYMRIKPGTKKVEKTVSSRQEKWLVQRHGDSRVCGNFTIRHSKPEIA